MGSAIPQLVSQTLMFHWRGILARQSDNVQSFIITLNLTHTQCPDLSDICQEYEWMLNPKSSGSPSSTQDFEVRIRNSLKCFSKLCFPSLSSWTVFQEPCWREPKVLLQGLPELSLDPSIYYSSQSCRIFGFTIFVCSFRRLLWFSVTSLATDVQQQVCSLLLWKLPVVFWPQLLAATYAVEALNMAHMDSMFPNSSRGGSWRPTDRADIPYSPSFLVWVHWVCPASLGWWTTYVSNYFKGKLIKVNTVTAQSYNRVNTSHCSAILWFFCLCYF